MTNLRDDSNKLNRDATVDNNMLMLKSLCFNFLLEIPKPILNQFFPLNLKQTPFSSLQD